MHAKIFSATTIGIDSHLVQIEIDVSFGLVSFYIVGLPDTAIKESSKRIITALKNSGIALPSKKITINLAPADLKKEGTLFDMPIAIGILLASNFLEISQEFIQETLFLGELSLDGSVYPIKGALAIACDAFALGKKRIIIPVANAVEAALIKDLEVIGVNHITELIAYLRKEINLNPTIHSTESLHPEEQLSSVDFSQVKGQTYAKRALQVSAAGKHNILFIGPPGAGKTMLAKRLPTIMPKMTFEQALQTSKIYSITGKLTQKKLLSQRPFRNPHHTISQAGLVGGGSYPQPGEISLAHHGILFLDELTEFKRSTLEVLRQPLETKTVCISRAQQAITYPASFLLVAALNPCPCGFWGDKNKKCHCNAQQIERYINKLSGPLLDRIDIQVNIQSVDYETIKNQKNQGQSSKDLTEKVTIALLRQKNRFGSMQKQNAEMNTDEIERYCILTDSAEKLLKLAFQKLSLSMRGYHKILKVARTIADLEESDMIDVPHVQESIMYRSLDQNMEQKIL
jgi:magnesium chelatase family protein